MKKLFLAIFTGLSFLTYAQSIDTLWTKSMGGSNEDLANSIIKTSDGGFLVTGSTSSSNGFIHGSHGGSDCWIVKLNQYGDTLWSKAYGGSGSDLGRKAIETNDGGFLVAASSKSSNGDLTANNGGYDFWVFKLDSGGNLIWSENYGGTADDLAYDLQKVANTGYVIVGSTNSNNLDVTLNHGSGTSDIWVVKTDLSGNLLKQKSFGGSNNERAFCISPTVLGGFIIGGDATSNNGDLYENKGATDLWLIKISDDIDTAWTRTYGGSGSESAHSVMETADLGYLVAGYTSSNNGDVQNNLGMDDFWVLKLNQFGDTVWTKVYGGTNSDIAYALQQIVDSTLLAEDNQYIFDGVDDYVVLEPNSYGGFQNEMFVLVNATIIDGTNTIHLFKLGGDNNRAGMNVQFRANGGVWVTHNNAGPSKTITKFDFAHVLNEQEEAVWGFSNTLNENIKLFKNGSKIGDEYYPNYDSTCYAGGVSVNCDDPSVDSVDNGRLGDPQRIYVASKNDISDFFKGSMRYFALFNLVPDESEIASMSENIDNIPAKYMNADQFPQVSGALVVGQQYRILKNSGGANFTSAGAPNNNVGTVFIATGTSVTWGSGALYAEGVTILLKNNKTSTYWFDDLGNSDASVVSVPQILDTYDQLDYVVAGKTSSGNGDVTGHHGNKDAWVVNIDKQGTLNSAYAYGGTGDEEARSVVVKDDGYYAFAGFSNSSDNDVHGNQGGNDFWVVNTGMGSDCPTPINLAESNITISSAELGWTAQGSSTEWEIMFGTEGFDTTGYTTITVNQNPHYISGLNASTSYDWYIRSVCGTSNSNWAGPSTFTTQTPGTLNTLLSKTYGGSGEDIAYSIKQTDDQNLIVAGYTKSNNGDVHGFKGENDYWILKLDGNGDTIWTKTYGGSRDDRAYDIFQNFSGNYFVTGSARSKDGDIVGTHGSSEYWPLELDSNGDTLWTRCYGGRYFERSYQAVQTADSGFIFAGYTVDNSFPDTSLHRESRDYWILKTDKQGDSVWSKILGGTSYDLAHSVAETYDLGYIVAGNSKSANMDVHDNHGNYDMWVVRFNHVGDTLWTKSFGGSGRDETYSIIETSDNGYAMAGSSSSTDYDVHGNKGGYDFWVVKMDQYGDTLWTRSYGGSSNDGAFDIQETSSGDFLVAGYTESNDGDVTGNHGLSDYWIIKINNTGELLWSKTLGGSARDSAFSIQQTADGNILIAGSSQSADGDVPGNKGGSDFWIVKISEFSSCAPPTNLTAVVTGATSAELAWDENGTANSWQILIGTTGFDTTGMTPLDVTENPYAVSGLAENTSYDWYVRSNCGSNEASTWVGPASFITDQEIIGSQTLPFTETWENYSGKLLNNGLVHDGGHYSWSFETEQPNAGRLRWGDSTFLANNGTGAMTMDREVRGTSAVNAAILTLDLSAYATSNSLELGFSWADHRNEERPNNKVWVRGSNADTWVLIYTLTPESVEHDKYICVAGLDIDSVLNLAGQNISATFQVRFGQEDNQPTSHDGKSDGISYDDISIIDNVQEAGLIAATLPFSEGFESESGNIKTDGEFYSASAYRWSFETSIQNEGRLRYGDSAYMVNTGSGAITMDREVRGTAAANNAILTINLSNYVSSSGLELSFSWADHRNEERPNNRVWIRGSETDAWVEIYNLQPELVQHDIYNMVVGLDIDATLAGASPAQVVSSTFQLRLGQEDNEPTSNSGRSDGISFDDILIKEVFTIDMTAAILPFTEDWESSNGTTLIDGQIYEGDTYSWSFETSQPDAGRVRWGNLAYQTYNGSGALTMDRVVRGPAASNSAILTINLSNYETSSGLELAFSWVHHRNEERPNNKVWIRGSDTDNWVMVYDINPENFSHSVYQNVSGIDIDAALANASPSQTVSSTFQLRLGQEDNEPTANNGTSDGISFDDIIISNTPPFSSPLLAGDAEHTTIDNISVYSYESSLFIKSSGSHESESKSIFVFDIFGRMLYSAELPPSKMEKINLEGISGYMIVKVVSGNSVFSGKVFVK